MGCYEISLGDTVGTALPPRVTTLIDEVTKQVDVKRLAVSVSLTLSTLEVDIDLQGHVSKVQSLEFFILHSISFQFHDTFGMATANVMVAVNVSV